MLCSNRLLAVLHSLAKWGGIEASSRFIGLLLEGRRKDDSAMSELTTNRLCSVLAFPPLLTTTQLNTWLTKASGRGEVH